MIGSHDHPRVSVLMPLHNAEPYVAEAIESVCNQTHRNFELVIADDGSTDGSCEIAAGYAPRERPRRLRSACSGNSSRARSE
jgi:glycosyltransferase involved in cell wall biosynthesis